MRPSFVPLLLVAALSGVQLPAPLRAQGPAPARVAADTATIPCDGLTVRSIDIRPGRPPFEGSASRWRHVARAVGLHHSTTRPGVIDAFMLLEVGQTCTEERRRESERLIRDQPFLADARVTATPDYAGGVALVVETVDEIPVLVGGQLHGLGVQSISLGNGNVGGEGLLTQFYYERGFGYRDGFGVRAVEYATFGRPYATTIEAFKHPLGAYGNFELAHPFYTDLQRYAWSIAMNGGDEYRGVLRPARDPLNLRVPQQRWSVSTIARVLGSKTVFLLGAGASGIRITPADTGVLVEDEGLRPDTGTALRNRYQPFRAVRLGGLFGLRKLSYTTVRGFDALFAQQDVPSGLLAGMFVAHGLPSAGESDLFLSGGFYTGKASTRAILAAAAQMEARRDPVNSIWDSQIGSGRAAFYLRANPGMLFTLDDRYSIAANSRLPVQLDLGDRVGGILGYHAASLTGARRNATQAELRYAREAMIHNADVGVALFGQAGTVWAGDVPYGTNASASTVGFSVLAAYPTRSKRTYRIDVGFPLSHRGSGGGIEVRFSGEDRTNLFWTEPDDIAHTRTGPVASTLFTTPSARQ